MRRFASGQKRVLFLGMNPGPWGMAQTGVPFGEVNAARDWMGIRSRAIGKPRGEHPQRIISGFDCPRSEVSGARLWGMFARRFPSAEDFFARHIVLNYCPLLFLRAEDSRCANITPDKLPASERAPLFAECDRFLQAAAREMRPQFFVGVGAFAGNRLHDLFGKSGAKVGHILHPSPASPAANRGFAAAAEKQLTDMGVW